MRNDKYMNYASLVTKKNKYKYSANIYFDTQDESKLSEFIPNLTTTEILREYLIGIINQNTDAHSRILYGSYGTGKSHLLTVISDLLSHNHTDGYGFKEFLKAISKYDENLSTEILRFVRNEKPYIVVPVYANFDEFDKCITFSLKKEFERRGINLSFKSYFDDALKLIKLWESGNESKTRLKKILKEKKIKIEELVNGLNSYDSSSEKGFEYVFKSMTYGADFVNEAGNMLDNLELANDKIKDDYRGIVFLFDEFGRYVEDFGNNIKVKAVQDLAEFCDHSGYDDYLFLVSHKQLSLYTDKMKKSLSDEWKKIEGRFRSTSINIKYDQCLSLIPHIIPKTDLWDKYKIKFQDDLCEIYVQAYDFKGFLLPPEDNKTNPFEGGFPLHPITLYALDRLSKKVAQNERTFFTYLASDEENSLFNQLEKMNLDEFHFVGLDAIYDYFEENICAYRTDDVYDIYKKLQFAINKLGNTKNNALEIRVLKVIAVIYIIGDSATLAADLKTLTDVVDSDKYSIRGAIDNLVKLKIIKYMRQYGYYDFLDSSIYDFESMIDERISSITDEMAIGTLNEEFSDFAIYPHKYNFDYHMNRVFLPVFAQKAEINKKSIMRLLPKYYDGVVLFILDKQFIIDEYKNNDVQIDRSLFIINQNEAETLLEVKRYIAIKYFYSIREELKKDDPTVEKELLLYLNEQKGLVSDIIAKWNNINDRGINVVVNGNEYLVKNGKEVTDIASDIMMQSYTDTIIVNNDLINKNILSGAIKQARSKALSLIMNEDNILENCSLLSPEHSIIRSVLSKNGIYKDENISRPNILPTGSISGEAVIKEIDKFLNKCLKGQVCLLELYDKLKRPPFGLRDGYIPVLLAYELKKYANVSIYFHGSEHDYCEDELVKALENPEHYNLYICNWTEEQTEYINGLEKLFTKYINHSSRNRLKELFNAMNKHFISISKAARTTDKYVSESAKLYRDIMSITCKDYNKFFFEKLPQINDDLQSLVIQISNIILELENVTSLQIVEIIQLIRTILKIDPNVKLAEKIHDLYENEWKEKRFKSFDYHTNVVLDYLETMYTDISNDKFAQDIAKIVTGFEIEYWNDSKMDDFFMVFSKIVNQLNDYVIQNELKGNEIKITINVGQDQEKTTQFDKTELSGNSQMMFNKMKATIDNFGESISYEEKLQVLAKIFSEIM